MIMKGTEYFNNNRQAVLMEMNEGRRGLENVQE